MQTHTKNYMGVIRSRSESFGIAFDYNSVHCGIDVIWLEYGAMGMKIRLYLFTVLNSKFIIC